MKDNKVIFVQPALPSYRVDFFNNISIISKHTLVVYYSDVDMSGLTQELESYSWGEKLGRINNFMNLIQWQSKAVKIPITKNDVIVVSGAPRCISNLILLIKAKTIGAKIIWWGHLNYNGRNYIKKFINKTLMKFSSALLFYTDREVEVYKKNISYSHPAFALNNGINTKEIKVLRRIYNPKDRNDRIVFIGRITEKSNIKLLIEALNSLSEEIILDIIGDGELKNEMINHATVCNVEARVVWHGAIVEEKKISEIMNTAKINVYPGDVGLSLIHAMAYGLPTIIHGEETKHMPEVYAFENNKTGELFEYNSPASLAKSIQSLISDDSKLYEYALNCIKYTDDNFNTVSMSNRFISMLDYVAQTNS